MVMVMVILPTIVGRIKASKDICAQSQSPYRNMSEKKKQKTRNMLHDNGRIKVAERIKLLPGGHSVICPYKRKKEAEESE
jgi:hypothetical protein